MEFKSLRNIETSFQQVRLYALLFMLFCLGLTALALYKSYAFVQREREKIYVLDEGKSLMLALSQDAKENRPIEARQHVRLFHELFFSVAPDKEAIEEHMRRAFVLADRSAYDYYKDLSERGFYQRMVSGNILQRVVVDSLQCDFESYPYRVKTFAKTYIIRQSNITERSLVTECQLLNSSRSESNPHGFMIEGFVVLENQDIRTLKR